MGALLFLIMISDIDRDVSASKLVSFADDTRLYSGVGDVTDCDNRLVCCICGRPWQGRTGPGGKGGVPPQAPCLIKFIRIDIDLYIR